MKARPERERISVLLVTYIELYSMKLTGRELASLTFSPQKFGKAFWTVWTLQSFVFRLYKVQLLAQSS